ncbi:MAG: hypothetical protein KAJ75_01240, partial [Alphaproteobacteria bacterium]|nr:hypothetical protein [Alphaproteobacteria bacterium]
KGIDKKIFLRLAGVSLENAVNKDAFAELCKSNLLENNEFFLRTTAKGKLLLNTIIEKLLI